MDARTFTGVFTEEHETLVAGVCDEWTESGLSTEPVDRRAAEQAVREAYTASRLEPPGRIVWAGSPAGCLRACLDDDTLGRPRLAETPSPELVSGLRRELRRRYRSNPWRELEDQLARRLHDELGAELWDELRTQIGSRIREPLWNRLRVRLRGHVLSRLSAQPSVLCGHLGGVQDIWRDAHWMALYTCALQIAKMRDGRLETLVDATRRLGWWIPSGDGVILSERPTVLRRDELERLHCATGPALSWRDGYALHAWHGTPVPEWVVKGPTREAIRDEDDPEIRRCAIESFGWERYIRESGLPLVAEIEDPRDPGSRLALYDLPEHVLDERLRVLVTPDVQAGNVYLVL
ncbi:DUF6745 domain-containing protein [Microtetraspora glauca]|uniref:DUF6745 domain-containing protein n=1 Tax=Microtetraspora glauca TaxID=1996 RepID=A0ABV3G9Q4_MICGL